MSGTGRAAGRPQAVRRRVVVHGGVQGVGFRASCAGRARAHGVAGWVRNRPDGTVEAAFEGDAAAVTALVDWCRTGPSMARVTALDVTDEEPAGETTFAVR